MWTLNDSTVKAIRKLKDGNLCIPILFQHIPVIRADDVHADFFSRMQKMPDEGIVIIIIHTEVVLHFFQRHHHACRPPVRTSTYMPEIAAGAKTIAFGDFSYYWIADRQGRSFKRLNELFSERLLPAAGKERPQRHHHGVVVSFLPVFVEVSRRRIIIPAMPRQAARQGSRPVK